jgi:hypothetical protein
MVEAKGVPDDDVGVFDGFVSVGFDPFRETF